ncbi:glycosyltransferase family 2 protein [Roseivirga sp.]|uniref:glycosyltransferase family 2 protein n=1 Tax=Roseivirga sp. TaxID=1964215 RepID=UPI003B8D06D4
MKKTSISIIIPAHQVGALLNQCLQSIIDFGNGVKEVILVLDGIPYKQEQLYLTTVPDLIVERLAVNRGPAHARNHGVQHASGDVMFFLDSDVQLLPDTIGRVKSHFEKSHATEAIIGSYDKEPYETSLVSKYRNLLHHFTHQTTSEQAATFWGACGAIKRDVFNEIGGFNVAFDKPSVEDIELGYRLIKAGYTIHLEKHLQVKHLKKWTVGSMLHTDIFLRARPWTLLLYQRKKLASNDLNLNIEDRLATFLLLLGLTNLVLTPFWSEAAILVITSLVGLILLKRKIYHFFASQFNFTRLPFVLMFHWLYLACAFTGFVLGTCDYLRQTRNFRPDAKVVLKNQHKTNS